MFCCHHLSYCGRGTQHWHPSWAQAWWVPLKNVVIISLTSVAPLVSSPACALEVKTHLFKETWRDRGTKNTRLANGYSNAGHSPLSQLTSGTNKQNCFWCETRILLNSENRSGDEHKCHRLDHQDEENLHLVKQVGYWMGQVTVLIHFFSSRCDTKNNLIHIFAQLWFYYTHRLSQGP